MKSLDFSILNDVEQLPNFEGIRHKYNVGMKTTALEYTGINKGAILHNFKAEKEKRGRKIRLNNCEVASVPKIIAFDL